MKKKPSTVPLNTAPTRYHPALVGLHWLLALLILLALGMGTFVLKETPNAAVEKIGSLRGHMIMGFAIGALMLMRLVVRSRTARPPAASTGNALLDTLGHWAHIGLYLLVFVMVASGVSMAVMAGLPDIVFGSGVGQLPESFSSYPPRAVHGWIAKGLAGVIGLHVIGALFHQFWLKDRLLSRMGFGSRNAVKR